MFELCMHANDGAVCLGTHATVYLGKSEDNFMQTVLSSNLSVGTKPGIQVTELM